MIIRQGRTKLQRIGGGWRKTNEETIYQQRSQRALGMTTQSNLLAQVNSSIWNSFGVPISKILIGWVGNWMIHHCLVGSPRYTDLPIDNISSDLYSIRIPTLLLSRPRVSRSLLVAYVFCK